MGILIYVLNNASSVLFKYSASIWHTSSLTVYLFRQQGFMADAENLQCVVKSILFLTEDSPQELFGQTSKLKRSTNLRCPRISHVFKIMQIQEGTQCCNRLHYTSRGIFWYRTSRKQFSRNCLRKLDFITLHLVLTFSVTMICLK